MKEKHMPYNLSHQFCYISPHRQYSNIFVNYKSMNKGDLTNSNDNKAHARKVKVWYNSMQTIFQILQKIQNSLFTVKN